MDQTPPPPTVKSTTEINDIRDPPDFRSISFSGYKKADVRNQLIENLQKGKMEQAQYWAVEFVCAGHYADLWEIIFYYMGKYIHLGNPKVSIYIENRYTIFQNIMNQGQYLNELQLRNHPTIRHLYAEIVGVLLYSPKRPCFELLKINREEEFDITQMTERLKAPDVHFISDVFQKDDPKEIFIPLNELAFQLNPSQRNMMTACYWIEWLLEFDALCKKKKTPVFVQRRPFVVGQVENKYTKEILWVIFDVFFDTLKRGGDNPFLKKVLSSLLKIMTVKYSSGTTKKRRYILYMCVSVLCEPVPTHIDIMGDKKVIENVVEKIDILYKEIKKNEVSPNTDYLFHNLDRENEYKRTLMKMDMVNSADIIGGFI